MINLVWSGLLTLLLLSGCGFDGTPTRHNDFVPLTSIVITAGSPTIAAGTSTKLMVTGNYSGLFTRDITDQAVWSSGSTGVANFITAATPNRVTGIAPGAAVLTATVGGVSATYTVTVSSAIITALTIIPANPTIAKGLTTQFKAEGEFLDGTTKTTQDLTFDVIWSATPGTFATVGNEPANKGLATALAEGTETITASFGTTLPTTATTTLIVAAKALKSIAVTPANPSLLSLSTGSFTATGTYSDNSTADITSQVAWTSSNEGIAKFTSGGAATTLSTGTTTISATLGGVSGTTNLKVTGGNLTGFTVTPAPVTLVKDTLVRLTAIGTFSNGAVRDITGAVVWSTGNTTLATVTTPVGNLVLLKALAVTPLTTVTTKYGTLTATTNLTVIDPGLLSVTMFPPNNFVDLTVGTSVHFTVTANFNGTTQDVTSTSRWSSGSITAVVGDADPIAKGRVTGVSAGPATISASYGSIPVTASLTVKTRTLNGLTISPNAATTVGSGNQVVFTATALYTDGFSKDVTEDTDWTIDNANVAILADKTNQPGQIVGVDSGTATLKASFGGLTPTVKITVP